MVNTQENAVLLMLWEACGGENVFWQKYSLKSSNVKLCNGLCIGVGAKGLCGQIWGPLGAGTFSKFLLH